MRIPICFLCNKRLGVDDRAEDGAEWVEFANYRPWPNGEVWLDEPPGLECFCKEHLPAASKLSHLTSKEALIELERQFGKFPEPVYTPVKMTWWQWLKSWIP